jgi:DNA-binding NarL/FixJ family response regulator
VTRGRERAGGAARQRIVCLVSANPLALSELERLASRVQGMRVKRAFIDLNASLVTGDIKVPQASVYVLDSWSTVTATEAVVSAMHRRRPDTKLIVLSGKLPDAVSFAFLQLGVKGLIADKDLAEQLPRAVVSVASGGLWIPRAVLSKFLAHTIGAARGAESPRSVSAPRISHRERQVLNCVLKSQSNKEISAELHISESTVKFHLARLFDKFGVRRRADLILQTVQSAPLVH